MAKFEWRPFPSTRNIRPATKTVETKPVHAPILFFGDRNMQTIGEWLTTREKDQEQAWEILAELLWTLGPGVASCTRAPLDLVREDASQEALLSLLSDTSPLFRVDRNLAVMAFLWGYLENVTRRLLEKTPRVVDLPEDLAAEIAGNPEEGLPLHILTGRQREAVIGLREGRSLADLARSLGVSRTTARDRLERALNRMRAYRRAAKGEAEKHEGRRRADWLLAAAKESFEHDRLENVDILLLFATGASPGLIAYRRGLSRNAVKCRLRRMRSLHERRRQGARKATPPPRHFWDYSLRQGEATNSAGSTQ